MMRRWRRLQRGRACNTAKPCENPEFIPGSGLSAEQGSVELGDTNMRYHNITKDDMLNGDGLRVVLWVAGCSHGCRNCHNPITWDICGGIPFDEAAKEEIFEQLRENYVSGITFSGGDPLHMQNRDETGELVREIHEKFPEKTIWLYTGYLWEEVKDLPYIPMIDVLVDGRFVEELKDSNLHWKGSANQRVIDVKKTLEAGEVVLHA